MKFEINETEWTIKIVDDVTMTGIARETNISGRAEYKTQEILLLQNNANMIRTLKHELMHVWLWEFAHSQKNDTIYDYEDICEIVASSNNFVNRVVENFKKDMEENKWEMKNF